MFKRIDMYGQRIDLLYKGNNTIQTFIGAVFSVITCTFIFVYFWYCFEGVMSYQSSVKSITLFRENEDFNFKFDP